jgi:hypothetical protein
VKRDAIGSVLPAIVHPALYAAWLSRPRWRATLISLTQAIESGQPRSYAMTGLARNDRSRCLFALAIEAGWRKHAAGVVPAQPKARPEGQRPLGRHWLHIQTFQSSLKFSERIACAFRIILGQERHQADRKDGSQSIFLTKLLLFWSRPTATAPRRRRAPRR